MKKKRILILCPSPVGTNPGQRLKYEQYFDSWKKAGYTIHVSPFQTQRFWKVIYKEGYIFEKIFWTCFGYFRRFLDLFTIPFYDGIYIFMSVTPLGPPIFERLVCSLNPRVVFDMEDMAFMAHTSKANKWVSKLKGTGKYIYLMKKARYVITSAPGLTDFVKKYNNNVNHITATFNTDRFLPVSSYQKKEVTTIGWTGSHSTMPYLHLLDNVFKKLAKLRSIKVLAISNSTYTCDGVEVENIPWKEDSEISDLHRIDIGVYPVPKEPWVLGKSGCKAITYMSVGVPSVSTAYGNVVTTVVDNNVNGFLADTEEDWLNYLTKLIDDVNLRKQIGEQGRAKAVAEFSVKANTKKYLDIFEQVYGTTTI